MSNRTLSPQLKHLLDAKLFLQDVDNWCPEDDISNGCRMRGERRQLCAYRALSQFNDISACCILAEAAKQLGYFGNKRFIPNSTALVVAANAAGHEAVMKLYDRAIAIAMERQND